MSDSNFSGMALEMMRSHLAQGLGDSCLLWEGVGVQQVCGVSDGRIDPPARQTRRHIAGKTSRQTMRMEEVQRGIGVQFSVQSRERVETTKCIAIF